MSLPPVLIWCMCVYASEEDWGKGPQLLWTHCDRAAGRAFPRVLAVPSFMAHGSWKGPQSNLSRDHELHPLLPFVTTDDAYVVCPHNCYRRTVLWFMALASGRGAATSLSPGIRSSCHRGIILGSLGTSLSLQTCWAGTSLVVQW